MGAWGSAQLWKRRPPHYFRKSMINQRMRMKVHLLLRSAFLLFVSLSTGCRYLVSEPSPTFVTKETKISNVPENVMKPFRSNNPDARIVKVETSSFKAKPMQYRITFNLDKQQRQVIYDSQGTVVEPPGLFKPEDANKP